MNLYKIVFSHHAPKGMEEGSKCMVLANNDEQVYDWIASEPSINGETLINTWNDRMGDEEEYYNDETDVDETWKERMLRLRGEINDDSSDFGAWWENTILYKFIFFNYKINFFNANFRPISKASS